MYQELYRFLRRDFAEDIAELNELLQLNDDGKLVAEVPPNPFVGNPELISHDNSIAMIGINPAYRPNIDGFYHTEIKLPTQCLKNWKLNGDLKELTPWLDKIKNYFVSETYYGRYFTRLGNILGPEIFHETWSNSAIKSRARMVFHNHVLKLDIIPYYSKKANFDDRLLNIAFTTHPSLIQYHKFIVEILAKTNIKWIFLNGNASIRIIELLLGDGKFDMINIGPTKRTEISLGKVRIRGDLVPVLGVKFVNSPHGPTSNQDWKHIWPVWHEYLAQQNMI